MSDPLPRIARSGEDDWISAAINVIREFRELRLAMVPILAMLGDDLPSAISRAEQVADFMAERYEAFPHNRQGRLDPKCRTEAEILRRSYAILRQGIKDLRQLEAEDA
jgi:hypothetical protein